MKTHLYCLPPLLQISSNPPPPRLQPPTLQLFLFLCSLFLWLNGCSRHIWCGIQLNNIMDLHMLSLGALVPEGPWCVFYGTRRQAYWGVTHNVVFWYYYNLIPHTHTQRHTAHSGANRLTHSDEYLLASPAMCCEQLSVLH